MTRRYFPIAAVVASVLVLICMAGCSKSRYPVGSVAVLAISSTVEDNPEPFAEFSKRVISMFQTASAERGDFRVLVGKDSFYNESNAVVLDLSIRSVKLADYSEQNATIYARREKLNAELRLLEQNEKLSYGIQILGSKLASPTSLSNADILNEIANIGGKEVSRSARTTIGDLLERNSVKAGIFVFASLKKARGGKTLWQYQGWVESSFYNPIRETDQLQILYRDCESLLRDNVPYLRMD